MKNISYLLLGCLFGLILFKGEVASHAKIRAMFNFEEPTLFLIIASAIVVGIVSLQILKFLEKQRTPSSPISYPKKQMTKGVIIGGLFFGMGWYITGACPGPIAVQIGAGHWPAFLTLSGAIAGTYLYAKVKNRLPH